MYYVYVLKNAKDEEIYIGFAHNLEERMNQHNTGLSKFTRSKAPWELVYYEAFQNMEDARQRENRLKHHGQALRQLKERIKGSLLRLSHSCKVGAG
jgi:putative endonuclease